MSEASRKYPKTASAASLARHFAGGIDYIRTKRGRVMALTLKNSMNPDAPDFIVFGKGPRVEARARRTDTDDVVLRATAFPDAKTRKEIEQAAVRFVRKSLKARGYVVRDVQADKVGYDLHAKGPRGTLLVEVKGTDVDKPRFFITQNERHCARRRSNWRLFVVVAARTKPRLLEFTREEMERVFRFDVMSWQATWNAG